MIFINKTGRMSVISVLEVVLFGVLLLDVASSVEVLRLVIEAHVVDVSRPSLVVWNLFTFYVDWKR